MNTTPTNNFFASATAERLLQSASSLDSALSSDKKRNGSLVDFGSLDTIFGASELSATLFDDWLLNDVQQASLLGPQDDFANFSSDSDSNSGDSPIIGFDSIASDVDLMMGQTTPMALFPEAPQPSQVPPQSATGVAPSKSMLPLSPDAVRQAAAALNIPWSKGLEEAVLAQSLLASIPMTLAMPLASPVPTPAPAPKAPVSAEVAPPSPAISTPASPSPRSSPAPPMERERSKSVTPSIAPSTPRVSLSILSSATTTAVGNSGVKATVYKSAYREALLPSTGRRCNMNLKRNDREWDDTPSVLEGKDVAEMDEVALKRAKNTDAARRSRRKKLILMEGLEQRVAELEVENSMFESKLNEVELERSLLADKDQMQQARIMELEAMLSSLRQKMY
ncbi:hypothetical protein BGZ59_000841 [Podila verticillata]|nr:hypothetical protein BGZ59_000841 [Podila verticillata]KFH64358.1 hypothetical protein MVEG_10183 [Podila verticillata NRRL 6337]